MRRVSGGVRTPAVGPGCKHPFRLHRRRRRSELGTGRWLWRPRRRFGQERRRVGFRLEAPGSRARYCAILLEGALPRRDLGNRFIDRCLPMLFCSRAGGGTLKQVPLAALTLGAQLFVALAAALLQLLGIIAVLPHGRAFVAARICLAFRRTPLGIGLPLLPGFRRRAGAVVIVELIVAMALRRRDVTASELPVLLAITRLRLILWLSPAWWLRPVAIPLIRLITGRRRPRILLDGFMAAKPTHSIAVTDRRVSGAGCGAPLWLALLTIAAPRSIAMGFG